MNVWSTYKNYSTHLLAERGMPGSSEHRSWWRWLICTRERGLTKQWCWERWLQYTMWRQTHERWRCVVDNAWGRSRGSVRWRIAVTKSRRIVRKQLLKLLLKGRHVLVLLLKLSIALIETLKNLMLLLHVALLIKETVESLVGFLLPLLILLEWVPT